MKGIYWNKDDKKWYAQIGVKGKTNYLGSFDDKRLAGLTYDAAARLVWKPRFQRLNFMPWESADIILPPRVLRNIADALVSGDVIAAE